MEATHQCSFSFIFFLDTLKQLLFIIKCNNISPVKNCIGILIKIVLFNVLILEY